MAISSKCRGLIPPVAIVIAILSSGAEARAQQQVDVVNGTSRPIRFTVFVPSPSNSPRRPFRSPTLDHALSERGRSLSAPGRADGPDRDEPGRFHGRIDRRPGFRPLDQ